jgi:hypothetical protein
MNIRGWVLGIFLLGLSLASAELANLKGRPLCFDSNSPYVAIVEIVGVADSQTAALEVQARKTVVDLLNQRKIPLATNCLLEGGYNLFLTVSATQGENQRAFIGRLQVIDLHARAYAAPVLHEVLFFGVDAADQIVTATWIENLGKLLTNRLADDWVRANPGR